MLNEITEPLLKWYRENKRSLPWRDHENAYYTWVSEIMLQQTRVEAVKPYFLRFIRELPDVEALAVCPEKKLMKLWEGLGYYNRVRNMQEAARTIVREYGGIFPADYQQLLALKGIGSYTAGAVASIAYGIPVPAVDGNVLRVVSRIKESRQDIMKQSVRNEIQRELQEILPADCPGDFNQALMELGAVVCVPNGPARCESCPLSFCCLAYKNGTVAELPVKVRKKEKKKENRTVLVIQDGYRTAIRKRPGKGLLAGLYELPNVEGTLTSQQALDKVKSMGLEPLFVRELETSRHIFSHIEWRMTGYLVRVSALVGENSAELLFVDKKQSEKQYAIPSAFGTYVKYMKEDTL